MVIFLLSLSAKLRGNNSATTSPSNLPLLFLISAIELKIFYTYFIYIIFYIILHFDNELVLTFCDGVFFLPQWAGLTCASWLSHQWAERLTIVIMVIKRQQTNKQTNNNNKDLGPYVLAESSIWWAKISGVKWGHILAMDQTRILCFKIWRASQNIWWKKENIFVNGPEKKMEHVAWHVNTYSIYIQ